MDILYHFNNKSDNDENLKINLDELYDKKKRRDLRQVSIFNKILNRIHKRIKVTGRNKSTDQHIWFTIPEYIFGEPVYDKADCIAYVVAKLESNKFHIRYIHPNTLFVSWSNWVPTYVRNEYRKRTGVNVDEMGQIIQKAGDLDNTVIGASDQDSQILNNGQTPEKTKKVYTSTDQYKPTGNLVYNPNLFEEIVKKVS